MQSTEKMIAEHTRKIELNTFNFVIKLLEKFPIELVIKEIKKYKRELEDEV